VKVTEVRVDETSRGARITASLLWDHPRRGADELSYLYRDTSADVVTTPGDALLAAVLVPAIALGEDVTIDAPVSRRLLAAVPSIGAFFASWVAGWRPSVVDAPAVDRSALRPDDVAAGFSGGVDSFYTVLRPREEPITTLITMLGLDYEVLVPQLEPYMQRLGRAAATLGRKHVVIESNVYAVGRKYMSWAGPRGFAILGSHVASLALGLGSTVRKYHIAASWSPDELVPWGTHPELDPLWSTEALDIVHDGLVDRRDKVRAIASVPIVTDHLHVCIQPRRDPANCGRCDKCVATALQFEVAGHPCRTLPRVTPRLARHVNIEPGWIDEFKRLREDVSDPQMRRAISSALRRQRLRRPLRPIGRTLRRFGVRRGPR
jgi:hypothetical protein